MLPWPDAAAWQAAVERSPLVTQRVLRTDNGLLYLDRYWREEVQVCDDLLARLPGPRPRSTPRRSTPASSGCSPTTGYDEQRAAARAAAERWTTVLTGGPGTGKTTTVAGLLALLAEQAELESGGARTLRIAISAPTGKASARLQQSVEEETQSSPRPIVPGSASSRRPPCTGCSARGGRDSNTRFRHDRTNRLPHDVVVVDETSMVSLTMMARLLEAVRPDARLVLVGDPGQLASVEAGAVLADLVDGFGRRDVSPVAALTTAHRFGGGIAELAAALRGDDADLVVDILRSGGDVELVDPADEAAMARVPGDGHRGRARRTSRGGGGRPPGRGRRPRPAPAALRPPRGSLRRQRLEPPGRAAGRRPHRRHPLRRVVRRPPGAGHRQRLRPGPLQRRPRGDRAAGRRPAARGRARGRRAQGVRDHPDGRRADRARDDGAQVAGLAGPRGQRRDAARRLAAAHPRALLHRRHPGPGEGPRDRHRGVGAGRRRPHRAARVGIGTATRV